MHMVISDQMDNDLYWRLVAEVVQDGDFERYVKIRQKGKPGDEWATFYTLRLEDQLRRSRPESKHLKNDEL